MYLSEGFFFSFLQQSKMLCSGNRTPYNTRKKNSDIVLITHYSSPSLSLSLCLFLSPSFVLRLSFHLLCSSFFSSASILPLVPVLFQVFYEAMEVDLEASRHGDVGRCSIATFGVLFWVILDARIFIYRSTIVIDSGL